jgi:ElaB/YqjD/DUF883 family membrane-anchored ribosome-binding protein
MKEQILISQAFRIYEGKMNKIFYELNSIKESYSFKERESINQIFLEGWGDAIAGFGKKIGSFLGAAKNKGQEAVDKAKGVVSNVYDKAIQLGKNAAEAAKEFLQTINGVIDKAVESVKSAPGKLLSKMQEIGQGISSEVSNLYKKAKEKGGDALETVKTTIKGLYDSVVEKALLGYESIANYYKSKKEELANVIISNRDKFLNAANQAASSGNSFLSEYLKKIHEGAKKGSDFILKMMGNGALLVVGLLVVSVEGIISLSKTAFEGSKEVTTSVYAKIEERVKNFFEKNKQEASKASEFWGNLVSAYKDETSSNEGYIIKTFESFTKVKY